MAIFEINDSPILHWSNSHLDCKLRRHWKCWRQKIWVSFLWFKMFLVTTLANSFEMRWEIGAAVFNHRKLPIACNVIFLWQLYHNFFGFLVFVVSRYGTFPERSGTVYERSGTVQERFRNALKWYRNGSGMVQEWFRKSAGTLWNGAGTVHEPFFCNF